MRTIVLLGDSLIEYGDWQKSFPAERCFNFGIGGETVGELRQRLSTVIAQLDGPDVIVLMSGTNNLAMDDIYFVPDYEEIVRKLADSFPNARIFLTSLLPVDFPWQPTTLVPHLNAKLQEMCGRAGAVYLDLHSRFLATMEQGLTVFETDGVHLNPTGYALWEQAIAELLSSPE